MSIEMRAFLEAYLKLDAKLRVLVAVCVDVPDFIPPRQMVGAIASWRGEAEKLYNALSENEKVPI